MSTLEETGCNLQYVFEDTLTKIEDLLKKTDKTDDEKEGEKKDDKNADEWMNLAKTLANFEDNLEGTVVPIDFQVLANEKEYLELSEVEGADSLAGLVDGMIQVSNAEKVCKALLECRKYYVKEIEPKVTDEDEKPLPMAAEEYLAVSALQAEDGGEEDEEDEDENGEEEDEDGDESYKSGEEEEDDDDDDIPDEEQGEGSDDEDDEDEGEDDDLAADAKRQKTE